jgi:hypothetical protein
LVTGSTFCLWLTALVAGASLRLLLLLVLPAALTSCGFLDKEGDSTVGADVDSPDTTTFSGLPHASAGCLTNALACTPDLERGCDGSRLQRLANKGADDPGLMMWGSRCTSAPAPNAFARRLEDCIAACKPYKMMRLMRRKTNFTGSEPPTAHLKQSYATSRTPMGLVRFGWDT